MKAYTGSITKEQFVRETKRHQRLDHFLQGTYSDGVKGCAVGCAVKSINKLLGAHESCADHAALERYGICPEWLAKLQDTLFEGVSLERSKSWPVEFAEAINEGADLDAIRIPFLVFILEQNIELQEQQLGKHPELDSVIQDVIAANKQVKAALLSDNAEELNKARGAAAEAARSAQSAAWSAADAAWSAAWSTWSAANAAWSAAWSTADAADAAVEVAEVVRAAAYEKYADKLLELIRECK